MVTEHTGENELCEVRCVHLDRVQRARDDELEPTTLDALVRLFRSMGDPTRLRMLHALGGGEMCVCDLAAVVGVSESAVSHQLRRLRDHALVSSRREGQVLYYSLSDRCPITLVGVASAHLVEGA